MTHHVLVYPTKHSFIVNTQSANQVKQITDIYHSYISQNGASGGRGESGWRGGVNDTPNEVVLHKTFTFYVYMECQ